MIISSLGMVVLTLSSVDVTFFVSAKKKVTKEKTRCYGNALNCFCFTNACAIRTLRYAAFGRLRWVHLYNQTVFFFLFFSSAKKLLAKAGRTMVALCDGKGIAILA
ncbi:hypothetical protein FPZ42_13995 [Mucilaginibacter achroorhodeus]|uniref:Uncharacterized protein n=2 Tax=Mucilaginibacter achroorhodeus TaxID=2599294 RepID=A0A563U0G9_9SPHI|nr:hypothetical protein FPZ42_13995 [Mucilaginibacter achroorhodeus]